MAIKFLNTATGITEAAGDNSTKIATTAYVDAAAGAVPIGDYLPLTGGTLTGALIGASATFSSNITSGSTTKTTSNVVRSLAADTVTAGFEAYGASQGTGYAYVGQSSSYGGGMFYNGDGTPAFATGETADRVSFYRRTNNANTVVFEYPHNSSTVTFKGPIIVGGTITGQNIYGNQFVDAQDNAYYANPAMTSVMKGASFDGDVTVTTQAVGDDSTLVATTEYADRAAGNVPIGNYVTLATEQTITGAKTINTLKIGSANKIQFANNDFIRYEDATGVGRFHFDSDGGTNNSSVQAATFVGDLNGTINTATTGTTQTAGDSSTLIATTEYVDSAVAGVPQGDITAVTAGTFLTGGGTSGTVTLGADASKLAHIVDSANASVAAGWITVAEADTGRRAGEIYVTDGESGDHSFIRIDWMRSYNDSNFTVLNCGGHQNRIQGVRVLQEDADTTYGPKYLQVKVTVTSNYYVIITAPGTIPNYSDFTAVTPVLEDTKTGYSVTGAQLEDLQNSSVGTDEGITVGGALYVNGTGDSSFVGNVGIGTDSPSEKLSIETNAYNNAPEYIEFTDAGAGSSWVSGQDYGGMQWFMGDGTGIGAHTVAQIKAQNEKTGAAGSGALVFSTAPYNTVMSERMRINQNGVIRFNAYGAGTLVTDAQGNVTVSGGGGAGGPYLPLSAGSSYPLTGRLDLTSTGGTGIRIVTGDTSEGYLVFGDAADNSMGGIAYNNNTNTLSIDCNNSERITILSGGNVGIGTTDPLYKLQVQDRIHIEDTTSQQPKISFSENTSNSGEFVLEYNGAGAGAGNYVAFYSEVSGWASKGNGLNYIPSLGYVGIGTTSPAELLNVNKENAESVILISRGGTNPAASTDIGKIKFASDYSDVVTEYGHIKTYANSLSATRGSMDFSVKSTSGAVLTGMTVHGTSAGVNVGIGVTTASNKLHVHTDTDDAYAIRIEGSTNNVAGVWTGLGIGGETSNTKSAILFEDTVGSYARGKLHLCVNNGANQDSATPADAALTITPGGNVGIGTTGPGAKLDIQKNDDTVYDPSADDGQRGIGATIQLNNNSTVTNTFGQIMHDTDSSGQAVARVVFLDAGNASSAIAFVTENGEQKGERMRIAPSGSVGIGTNNPDDMLEVYGSSPNIRVTNTAETDAGIVFNDAQAGGGQMAAIKFNSSDEKLKFFVNDEVAQRMVIDTSGNVGIGATSPTDKLVVQGDGKGFLVRSNDFTISRLIPRGQTSTNWDKGLFSLYSGSTEAIRIDTAGDSWFNGGKVGIGTTTPSQALEVNGTVVANAIKLESGSNFYLNVSSYSNSAYLYGYASGSTIYFGQPATWTQNIRANGNISGTSYTTASDKRLKDNIKPIGTKHLNINWKNFELKSEPGIKRTGVIAQELEESHPEFVKTDEGGFKSVAYTELLIAKIAELELRINKLENNKL